MFNKNLNEENREEHIPSTYQEYLDEALKMRNNLLKDNIPCDGILKNISYRTVGEMNAPAIDWSYLVGDIEIVDTFVFNLDNPKYMRFTINRLIETLALYKENSVSFTNPMDLVKEYQHLIGTKVSIMQYDYNGFKKYKVLSTEKTSSI